MSRNYEKEGQEKHGIEWEIIARELQSPARAFHEVYLQALQPAFMELAAKNSMLLADQLQHFIGKHFPSLQGNVSYARHLLEQIHHMRMEAPVTKEQDMLRKNCPTISNQYISFLELKTTLSMPKMISQRLAKQDPYPLVQCLKTTKPECDVPPSVLYLPTANDSTFRQERPREFRANVCKRSRKWLGGPPRPRILIVNDTGIDLFKKGDKKKASKSMTFDQIDTISISQLEFTLRTKDGRSLLLTCETPENLRQCVTEIATHCLFFALDTGQPVSEVVKFLRSGARVHGPLRISPTLYRQQLLKFPTDALGVAFVIDEKNQTSIKPDQSRVSALLAAGAQPQSLLRWTFASAFFLNKGPLSRNILDFFQQHRLQLNTAGDDIHKWSLLQYLCLMRNVSSIERFLQHVKNDDLFACLSHVNGDCESVLHVILKHSKADPDDAELIVSMLLKAATSNGRQSPVQMKWLNFRDQNGDTPLHVAMKASMWTCVEKLVAAHACTNSSNHQGNTVIHLALKLDAPYPLECKLIRAASGRYHCHSQEEDGLERRDANGDTALSLAVKLRNEAIVLRLLECGAQPDVVSCDWQALHPSLSSTETPLHVAIKIGLPCAAQALVQHGAIWHVPDSRGSTPICLALRYGMYSLAYELLGVMSGLENIEWLDKDVGDSVFGLAMKAGQLELASLLLDHSPKILQAHHMRTFESPLHYAMKLREWLEFVEPKQSKHQNQQKKFKRNRFKSKSDGDLASLLVGEWTTITPYDSHAHLFVRRALEGMVLGLLKQIDPKSCIACPQRDDLNPIEPVFHLINTDDCITDHHVDCFTPLHAAARGGSSMNHILRWILLRLDEIPFRIALNVCIGPLQETPLHAAVSASTIENAMDLLDFIGKQEKKERLEVLDAVRADFASALHLACLQPNTKMPLVVRLLEQGVYTGGWENSQGFLPLHIAIQQGADDAFVELMFSHECDINARTEDGRTPLMVALQANNESAFHKLIQLGANTRALLPGSRLGLVDLASKVEDLQISIIKYLQGTTNETIIVPSPQAHPLQNSFDSFEEVPAATNSTLDNGRLYPSISISRLSGKSLKEEEDDVNDENDMTKPTSSVLFDKISTTSSQQIWLNRLKEEEKATLQLVAVEAKQQARGWLSKRIGKQKVLSDSLLICQQYYIDHGSELDPQIAMQQAEKLFIDRHVSEMVAEARLEIEREKQALLYEATRVSLKEPVVSCPNFTSTSSTTSTFLIESFISHEDDQSYRGSLDPLEFEMRKTLC